MEGILISGTGKGSYFVNLYSDLFQQKLGFKPFSGTLNLKINKTLTLNKDKKIIIKKEDYGQVDCYPILIQNNFKGYLLRPHKTQHPNDIIEIISPIHLREKLNLNDGDMMEFNL
ncbi:MAG: DUF120 domain-containing protein [Candidatus Woesearchaeota archaeon]